MTVSGAEVILLFDKASERGYTSLRSLAYFIITSIDRI